MTATRINPEVAYSSTSVNGINLYKFGRVVTLAARWVAFSIAANTSTLIATLPEGYRPIGGYVVTTVPNNNYRAYAILAPNGNLTINNGSSALSHLDLTMTYICQ